MMNPQAVGSIAGGRLRCERGHQSGRGMSTRLHALGFPASWTPRTAELMEWLALEKSRLVRAAKGSYRCWRSPQGAELWFHYPDRPVPRRPGAQPAQEQSQPGSRIIAVTPFHRGLSSCRIKVGRYLALDRANPLEGSCLAWLPAAGEGGREQVIVLELAPYGLQPLKPPPYATTAQIVCFAHAVWAYPNAQRYSAETPSNRRINMGAFAPVTEADVPEVKLSYRHSPVTLGLVTGTVKRSIRHLNPATNSPYYWLLLETKRGSFDVIANPSQVSGDISEGHVAQVCGSFLARLAGATV